MMSIKRLLYCFVLAVSLFSLSSCVDENTEGLLPEENAYNSSTNL